jgi:hypothetical protein
MVFSANRLTALSRVPLRILVLARELSGLKMIKARFFMRDNSARIL